MKDVFPFKLVPFQGGFHIYMQKKDVWGQNWPLLFLKKCFEKEAQTLLIIEVLSMEGLLCFFWGEGVVG